MAYTKQEQLTMEFEGIKIAEIRAGLGWTRAKLAEELGLTYHAIRKVERGERRLSLTAKKLFRVIVDAEVGRLRRVANLDRAKSRVAQV